MQLGGPHVSSKAPVRTPKGSNPWMVGLRISPLVIMTIVAPNLELYDETKTQSQPSYGVFQSKEKKN